MYIVLIDGRITGVFTSCTDAHEVAKKNAVGKTRQIFYCPANSEHVSLWYPKD